MAFSSEKTARVVGLTGLLWAASQFLVPWLVGSALAAIDTASGGRLDPFIFGGIYNLILGPVLMGGVAAYFTIALWRRLPALHAIQARTVILVSIAALFLGMVLLIVMSSIFLRVPQEPQPTPGGLPSETFQLPGPERNFVTGFLTWILPGVLIGASFAREIDRHGPKLTRRQVALSAAGWGLGFAIGGGLGRAAGVLIYSPVLSQDLPVSPVVGLLMLLPDAIKGLFAGLIGAWSTLHGIQADTVSPKTI